MTYSLTAESQAINNGQHWQGFKLVRGRSTRRYVNDDQAAKRLIAAGYSNIYRQSLLGITDMERFAWQTEIYRDPERSGHKARRQTDAGTRNRQKR